MEVDASQAATALLTEHLQYTPLSLIDDIIDSVNNLVYQGVGSLETGLFATPSERLGFKPSNVGDDGAQKESDQTGAKEEIEEGLHKLETLLNSTVDKNFDKFEIYVLRNILSIPSDLTNWVQLKHYNGLDYETPANIPTPESVQLLRKKLAASRNVSKTLLTEQSRNEAILSQLRGMLNQPGSDDSRPNLAFLSQMSTARGFTGQQSLNTNTNFSLLQLPALKGVVADLRSKMATLKESPATLNTAKDEQREERREYVEQRTKTHLERNGQMVDDSGPVPGPSFDKNEVEALERYANMFKPK